MKSIEYSPFKDVYVPYIDTQETLRPRRRNILWEAIQDTSLPLMTRWVIYNALHTR